MSEDVWYTGDPLELMVATGEVLEAIAAARPTWHAHAACRGMGPELFFPERGASTALGKAVCSTCPVAAECAADASDVRTVGRAEVWATDRVAAIEGTPASIARGFGVSWSTVWSAVQRIGRCRVEDPERVGETVMVGLTRR